jgi:hypothetical protein
MLRWALIWRELAVEGFDRGAELGWRDVLTSPSQSDD